MAAVTSAVVATGVAVKGQRDQRKAQKKAAGDQRQATIESASLLAEQGQKGEADVLKYAKEAAQTRAQAATDAVESLSPFAKQAEAFTPYKRQVMEGGYQVNPLTESVRLGAASSMPGFFGGGNTEEIAELNVQRLAPEYSRMLLPSVEAGMAAQSDIADIKARGYESLGDLAGGVASQRASLLTGQTPALQQLSSSAQEARVLSGIADQQYRTNALESIAGLAGNLTQRGGK